MTHLDKCKHANGIPVGEGGGLGKWEITVVVRVLFAVFWVLCRVIRLHSNHMRELAQMSLTHTTP